MAKLYHADLYGLRESKYRALSETNVATTPWSELQPKSLYYLFVPRNEELLAEYEQGWKVTDIFPVSSVGIVTARDDFVLDFDESILKGRISDFRGAVVSDEELRERFGLKDKEGWALSRARQELRKDREWDRAFTRCLYRPFDLRSLYYHSALVERTRYEVMHHMLAGDNMALVCPRRVETIGSWQHVLCCKNAVEHVAVSLKTIDSIFPLYLYPTEGEMQFEESRRPNLNPSFVAELCSKLGLPLPPWVEGQASESSMEQAGVEQAGVEQAGVEQAGVEQAGVEQAGVEQAGVPVLPVKQPLIPTVGQSPSTVQNQAVPKPKGVGPELTISRRHLPHWQLGGSTYFVTFRVREGITLAPEERKIVLQSCLHGHPRNWRLHAATVLADHVHLLLTPAEMQPGRWVSLSEIMQGIKGATAHQINRHRARKGPLWQDESFDRIIRDEAEFTATLRYIHENSMKATLDDDGLSYPFFWWEGKDEPEISPEDVFNYAYAVFHSPTYRRRYAEFLKIDFPRLPLTSDKALFQALVKRGAELMFLHLMESPTVNKLVTKYPVPGSNLVELVRYVDSEARVYINKTQYFEGVASEVWNFHIGGYQVCQKWLKDRKGRTLTFDDLMHYQKIVVALKETIRLMSEIDTLIPAWPLT